MTTPRYAVRTDVHDFNDPFEPFEADALEVVEKVDDLLARISRNSALRVRRSFWRTNLPTDLRKNGLCEIVIGGSYTITVSTLPDDHPVPVVPETIRQAVARCTGTIYVLVHPDYSDNIAPLRLTLTKPQARRFIVRTPKDHHPKALWEGNDLILFPNCPNRE